ncbi:MAG: terminase TerL endonuclease subunit [Oscillospiraceae bacterium]
MEKIISEQGFEVRRMRKADIKRFLALYFEASMNGEQMSPPTKELMKLVLEQRIAHGGHPVLHWMMDNIFIRTDPAGNIKPDKEKSTEKIDGAVATIMALDRAIRCGNENVESVYDTRGLLFI